MRSQTIGLLSAGVALLCFVAPAFAGINPPIPEPGTVLLLGGGLGAILLIRQMRAKKK